MSAPPDPTTAPAAPKLRSAIAWNFTLNSGRRITTTIVSIALAAILGPKAFGTVALATLFVVLLQLLFQQGFAPALIHRKSLDDTVLNAAFSLVVVGSIAMTLVTIALSEPLGSVLNDPALPAVLCWLSLQLPVQALGVVQESLLRRESDFRMLSWRTNISVLIGGVAGLALAAAGAGVYALVVQQLVTVAFATALIWHKTVWRPRFKLSLVRTETAREIRSYAGKVSIAAVAQFSVGQIDSFMVGAAFGVTAVGLYRLAGRLVETVLDVGIRTFQSAFLSDLARYDAQSAEFEARCIQQQGIACSLGMTPLGILAGASAALVGLLGPKWHDASAPLLLLSLGSLGVVFVSVATPILQVAGRPGTLARLQLATAAIYLVAFVSLGLEMKAQHSQDLAVVAVTRGLLGSTVTVVMTLVVLRRSVRLSPRALGRSAVPGLLASLAATGVGLAVHAAVDSMAAPVDAVLTTGAAGVVAVAIIVGADRYVRDLLQRVALRRAFA